MVRRVTRSLAAVAGAILLALVVLSVALVVLGWFAPPAVEHRPVDADDPPAEIAADAAVNLRATDYTFETTVERGRNGTDFETTVFQRVEVDNRGRAYYATVRSPPGAVNRSRPPVRYFADGPTGYRFVPAEPESAYPPSSDRGRWTGDDGLRFAPTRNALDRPDRLRGADATTVAANDTALVVRIENRSIAAEVGHPTHLDGDGANWTADLTLHVDPERAVVERAVLRYSDPARSVRVRTTWRATAVGRTHVQRPPGTLPPGPLEALYRLDLGVRTLAELSPGLLSVPTVDGATTGVVA